METNVKNALGAQRARDVAISLLHDLQHELNGKINSYWEYLRYGHKEQFEAYNKKDSPERLVDVIKDDYQTARSAIMYEAVSMYLKGLDGK